MDINLISDVDIDLTASDDISINASDNITIDAADNITLTSGDNFRLRNESTTLSTQIITDSTNNSYTWNFNANGDLSTPGDITVAGDITGTSTSSTLVLAAEPDSNTYIQLNDSVESIIRTVSNLEIRTDSSDTDKTWTFDTSGDLTAPGNISVNANVNLTGAEASDTARIFADVAGSTTSLVLEVGDDNADSISLRHYSFADNNTIDMLTATRASDTTSNVSVTGNLTATGNVTGNNLISSATIYSNVDFVVGNIDNASSTKTRITTFGVNSYIQTGNGTVGSTGNIVFAPYLDSTEKVVIDTASGNVTVTGNLFATGTDGNVVTRFESTWTVPTGNSTQSFTVDANYTYYLWVEGNIDNGIIAWNATATVTNTNVPVVGAQYAWVYDGGGTPIDFTSLPNQFVGTANTIVRSSVSPSATNNQFDFGINNTSGSEQTVRYGWVRIS
jgi:hypothetical protein